MCVTSVARSASLIPRRSPYLVCAPTRARKSNIMKGELGTVAVQDGASDEVKKFRQRANKTGGVQRATPPVGARQPRCLNIWTARSCRTAAARELNVPRFRRRPVRGFRFREYNRYFPLDNFRIIEGSTF